MIKSDDNDEIRWMHDYLPKITAYFEISSDSDSSDPGHWSHPTRYWTRQKSPCANSAQSWPTCRSCVCWRSREQGCCSSSTPSSPLSTPPSLTATGSWPDSSTDSCSSLAHLSCPHCSHSSDFCCWSRPGWCLAVSCLSCG